MKKNLRELYQNKTLTQIEAIAKLMDDNSSFASMGITSNLFEKISLDKIETISELIGKHSNTLGYSDIFKNSTTQIEAMAKLMADNSSFASMGITSNLFEKISLDKFETISGLILKQISLIENNNILDKDIENIKDTDEKIISQIAEVLFHSVPELNTIKNTLSKKQYFKMSIYLIVNLIRLYLYVLALMSLFEDKNLNSYVINRNNVLVKSEPSKENSELIIKLNRNHYVEKIDSNKNSIKIEFENENGELLEGWVKNDTLRKIEN